MRKRETAKKHEKKPPDLLRILEDDRQFITE